MGKSYHSRGLGTTASTAVAIGMMIAAPAMAQTEVPAPAQDSGGVETASEAANGMDITVTARRRDENLLQVPISITALSSVAIEARGIKDMVQISDFTPGFHFNNENLGRNDRGFTTLTFRGIDAGTFLVTRQPAQAFLDGIPIIGGSIPGLEDVERVEVIKGPQSAYFGRSTFSGAINFITKDPSYDFGGRIKAEAGSYGTTDESLMLQGSLIKDILAFRVTGRYYSTDGQYQNAANSTERLGARSTQSVAGTLLFQPTPQLKVKAYLGVWKDRDGPSADLLTGSAERNCDPKRTGTNTYVCGTVPNNLTASQIGKVTTITQRFRDNIIDNKLGLAGVFDSNFLNGAGLERHALQSTLAVGYELDGGIAIDLNGGYNYNNFQTIPGNPVTTSARTVNPSFGKIPNVTQFTQDQQSLVDQGTRAYGGELRVTSPSSQPFRWLVGASSYYQRARGRSRGDSNTGYNDSALITNRRVLTTGLFTGLAYDIAPRFKINAEGRYQFDKVQSQVIAGPIGSLQPGKLYAKTFKSFQPRVIIEFAPTPDYNFYVSAARSERPGDFNANIDTFSPAELAEIKAETGVTSATLDPEKLWMYEAGVKGRFFDKRLRLSLAGYYGDWTNINIFTNLTIGRTSTVGGTGRSVDFATASGNATLYGAELEGGLTITDNLSMDFGFAYTRSRLGSDYQCSGCFVLTGVRDVTGNQKARVPLTSGNVGVTYARPLNATYNVITRVDYLYKGNIYAEDANLAGTGAAHKVNLAISLERDEFSITAFGTNIFNNKTFPSMTATVNDLDLGASGLGRAIRVSLPDKPSFGVRAAFKF